MADGETPRRQRERNPEATTRDILEAARDEFVEHGLEGARIDRIAERARANKRLIYAYVGNKDQLYARVLHEAYVDIRAREAKLDLGSLTPVEGMKRLVGFTFDHFEKNPWWLRLLAVENMQKGRFVRSMDDLPQISEPVVGSLRRMLQEGAAAGDFRTDADPLQIYLTIAGLSWFYFSNIHTLSHVFGRPLHAAEHLAARRAHVIEVVLDHLTAKSVVDRK